MDKSLSSSTIIKIDWEFDIESDEQTQKMLGLSEGDIEVILEDPEKLDIWNMGNLRRWISGK